MNHSYHLSTKSSTSATVQSTAATSSETKPRRPNSELRKQQNRIASRNYREKRKRKLQQLEQLLDDDEDDDSNEGRAQTRSISPYQSRSGSGSVSYERSVASVSPHIATLPGNFSSPPHHHTSLTRSAWCMPNSLSPQQSLLYTHPYFAIQETTAHNSVRPTMTDYAALETGPSTFPSGYAASISSHSSISSTHASPWSSAAFQNTYAHTGHQQQAATNPYAPPWQYQVTGESLAGIVADPYQGRYHPYEPQ